MYRGGLRCGAAQGLRLGADSFDRYGLLSSDYWRWLTDYWRWLIDLVMG